MMEKSKWNWLGSKEDHNSCMIPSNSCHYLNFIYLLSSLGFI
uniref:Uncharacterized protein n=1 Tax=Rhizophora mucronata TaxID=61149 RepID=A0A2P2QV99_RHIMU